MADTSVTYRGLELPRWFETFYMPGQDTPTISIRVGINPETGPVPVGVMIIETTPVSTYKRAVDLLRGVAMEQLLHDAVLMAVGAWAWEKGRKELGESGQPLSQEQAHELGARVEAVREKAQQMPRPKRRRTTTPGLLKEAAQVYRKAFEQGHPPTVAVAEHFNLSHRSAARWVSQARDAGYLGPARGTRPGEAGEATPSE